MQKFALLQEVFVLDKRETVLVYPNAWHLRLYDWYTNTHPQLIKPKKDLCHYFWTDVWAVIYWYLRVGLWGGISAFWCTVILGLVGLTAYASLTWPNVVSQFLTFVGILALLLVLAAVIVFLASSFQSFSRPIRICLTVVFFPVWIPIALLCVALIFVAKVSLWLDQRFKSRFGKEFLNWFFTSHKFYVITPWLVSLLGLVLTLIAIFGFETVLPILINIVTFLFAIVLYLATVITTVAAIALFGSFAKEKWQDWRYHRQAVRQSQIQAASTVDDSDLYPDGESPIESNQPVVVRKARGTSSYRVVWQFLVAIKHRFCPYIEIVRD